MTKIHFAISAKPLPRSVDTEALCREVVPKAEMVSINEEEEFACNSALKFCAPCIEQLYELAGERRYVYALVSGEESIPR